jgi:hypothetical protein
MITQTEIKMTIEEGLDFILGHFQDPVWPRTISTDATDSRQVVVYGRKEALARMMQAKYMDCRISAYPPNVLENPSATQRFVGIQTVTPVNLIIMIDLDKCNFKTDKGFGIAYTRVLGNIKMKLRVTPTILWSGRGYHMILPLNSNGVILENIKEFEGTPNISLKFLRYAELFLSLKKSDPQHNHTVSFNNCLLRIPGSINSKNGQTVKVTQKWDGIRPEINYLLAGFTRYILNEKYLEMLNAQRRSRRDSKYLAVESENRINWIEQLLQTPIQDHRKYCIWRIFAPYLLNVRHLSYNESFKIIRDWLDRCDQLQRVDFNVNQRINEGLKGAERKGVLQISKDNLKEENGELHYLLQNS